MKKITMLILIITIALNSSCLLLNTVGLNPGHVKGTKAKEIINDKIMPVVLIDALVFGPSRMMLDTMSAEFAKIEDGAYYKKSEVEECGDTILMGGMFIAAPYIIGAVACNLQPDNAIIDI